MAGGGLGRPTDQTRRSITYCGRKMVLTTRTTFGFDTTVSTIAFWVHDSDTTERLKKAFTHAAILSGAKKELF
jgi:hypothetical protein